MTAVTTSPLRGTERRFGRISDLVLKTVSAIREGRRMLATYDELTRLSDSELARMGIRRQDIPQVVAAGH
ncbi:DUF1127 domain-containing protein [Azorhizobium sp. AG788]|uniref:DUF1127 domain-containing protein n=1 Tax=Azorhizobium sp. AG788 TaxID=2183897 RepID=UPI0031398242